DRATDEVLERRLTGRLVRGARPRGRGNRATAFPRPGEEGSPRNRPRAARSCRGPKEARTPRRAISPRRRRRSTAQAHPPSNDVPPEIGRGRGARTWDENSAVLDAA